MLTKEQPILQARESESLPLVIILMGPPGSGKGTHAVPLSQHLSLRHISTGDLFREHIQEKTFLGIQAKHFIDEGKLVPDELTLEMLFSRLFREDCKKGVILDGFPRTLPQAKALDQRLCSTHKVTVLQFAIAHELLVDRISGRIACKKCGTPFHKKHAPPKNDGECDSCKGPLYQRIDDTEEILRKRLTIYSSETAPLIEHYRRQDLLLEIDSSQSKSQVFQDVLHALRSSLVH